MASLTALALSARRPFGLARGLDKNSTCAANNQETDNDNDAIDNENDDSNEAHISGLVGNYLDNSEEWRDLENWEVNAKLSESLSFTVTVSVHLPELVLPLNDVTDNWL